MTNKEYLMSLDSAKFFEEIVKLSEETSIFAKDWLAKEHPAPIVLTHAQYKAAELAIQIGLPFIHKYFGNDAVYVSTINGDQLLEYYSCDCAQVTGLLPLATASWVTEDYQDLREILRTQL